MFLRTFEYTSIIVDALRQEPPFDFSLFALFHIVGITIVSTLIIVFLKRQKYRTLSVYFFALFLSSILLWGTMTLLQLSARIDVLYELFASLAILGWLSIPVFYVMFILFYTKNERLAKNVFLNLAIYGSCAILVYVAWNTDLIIYGDFQHAILAPWGLDAPGGEYLPLALLWVVFVFVYATMRVMIHYSTSTDPQLKNQIKIFIPMTLLPLFSAVSIDGILPQFGIQIYPLGFLVSSVLCIPMVSAIEKYGVFFFDRSIIEKNVVNTMTDAIVVADHNTEIRYVNNGAEKLFRMNNEHILSLQLHELMNPPKRMTVAECKKMLAREGTLDCQTKSNIPVHFSVSHIKNGRGRLVGYILNFKDVSELKKNNALLQESKERVESLLEAQKVKSAHDRALLNSIGEGIIAVDTTGTAVLTNPQIEQLIDQSTSNILKRKIWNVVHLETEEGKRLVEHDDAVRVALSTKERFQNTVYFTKTNGERLTLLITATPVINKEGKTLGAIEVIRDVTKERDVDRMKTEFVSIVSHQLRTPITAMNWYLEELFNEEIGKLNDEQKEYMKEVMSSNQRMVALINDLLNISRLESGRMSITPEKTDIMKLVRDVINDYEHLAKSHNCSISVEQQTKNIPSVKVDQTLIREVIANFVSNAVKYADPHKKKQEVTITLDRNESDIFVSVHDNGVGIPKEEQQRLFAKFFRASNVSTLDVGGTGLGLYITKLIVDASGGKIIVDSKEGKGSTFTLSLPLKGSEARKGERTFAH